MINNNISTINLLNTIKSCRWIKTTNQNLKIRLSAFISKREDPSKVLLLNMVYPKQAFPFGPNNSVKNARLTKKPKPIMITWRRIFSSKAACRTSKGKWLPKKSSGILCEGNRLEAYRFIQKYNKKFGLRWLLKKFNICPNAYYNYLKNRKADYHRQKDEIKNSIREIYHTHGGVDGYRTIHVYLIRKGHDISRLTVHKYMNTEMQLFSISRKKKPEYEHGVAH